MLPNAPTDNLYKFVTFIGMALFVFCTWQLNDTAKKVENQLFEAKMQSRLLMLRLDDSRETIARIEQEVDDPKRSDESKARDIAYWRQRLKEIGLSAETLMPEWEKTFLDQSRAQLQELQYLEDEKLPLQVGQWGGLAASVFGLFLWYVLHQRHQDGLLQSQRKTANSTSVIDTSPASTTD